ncbi:methyltransferase [Romboutsia sp.]|uniref:methyltransferase n=1 Tax=Romboutsia sp. TaxID=1965302 RepID=UPI003F408B94
MFIEHVLEMWKGLIMKENQYEELLNIKTSGEELWSEKVKHYHPYQATSYDALETLFKEYTVKEKDSIVDFGCGKGRLNFYINYFFKAKVTGIEMDEDYYKECLLNKENYLLKYNTNSKDIEFSCCYAQDYEIKPLENKFYFFNPFSVQIFRKIVGNILDSAYQYSKDIELILYYPSDDYIYFLENETSLILQKEVILDHAFASDNQERFLIYKLDLNI